MSFITSKNFLVICTVLLFASPVLVAMGSHGRGDYEEIEDIRRRIRRRSTCNEIVMPFAAASAATNFGAVQVLGLAFDPEWPKVIKFSLIGITCLIEAGSCLCGGLALLGCYKACKDFNATEPPLREVSEV